MPFVLLQITILAIMMMFPRPLLWPLLGAN